MKAQTRIDGALLRRQLAPVRAAWERQARRIDALSLRERAILFLCIVAVLAALFDALLLTPLSARQQQRAEQLARQSADVAQLREQLVASTSANDDPGPALRSRIEVARGERARLDAALRQAGSGDGGEALSQVLRRLLARQPGLVLERLALLDERQVAGAASAPAMGGMSWQGVELQVQGSYRETQRYVQALEGELPGLRWGQMRLSATGGDAPPRLQAQVFLLKVQP